MDGGNKIKIKINLRQKLILPIFGIFLFFIILEAILRLGCLIFLNIQKYGNIVSIRQKGAYRIMCIGESTTQLGGRDLYSNLRSKDSYPSQLEETLNQRNRNVGIKFSVINEGRSGINTAYILANIEGNLKEYEPNMVIAMMGINDGFNYAQWDDKHLTRQPFLKKLKIYNFLRWIWIRIMVRNQINSFHKARELGANRGDTHSKDKARNLIASDAIRYEVLGATYKDQGKYSESEGLFKKAITVNPSNDTAYVQLGNLYEGTSGKFAQAEQLFRKALEFNPQSESAFASLGWLYYHDYKKYEQAEEFYKRAIEIKPFLEGPYIVLGQIYEEQSRYVEAEILYKKAISFCPRSDIIYGRLGLLYWIKGESVMAKKYLREASQLREIYYNHATVENYQKLKKILDNKGIKLVCVQYPMRSVKPLMKIFDGQEKVIFVDNENIFKNAVKKERYDVYFWDTFGGDFGHCTPKGNKLLAENIAQAILKEVFGK